MMVGFVVCSMAGCSTKTATETAKETTQTETTVTKSEETTAKTDAGTKKKYVIGLAMNTQPISILCRCKRMGYKKPLMSWGWNYTLQMPGRSGCANEGCGELNYKET